MSEFLLPDLGEGLTEASIVSWLVAPGDLIEIDQPVVEVESAKSIVELPSPYGGRVGALHAAEGEVVSKGAPLITVLEGADEAAGTESESALSDEREPAGDESGAVLVGYGTRESTIKLRRPVGGRFGRGTGEGASPPVDDPGANGKSAGAEGSVAGGSPALLDPERHSAVVSPLIRKLARTHGFDATHLAGSGPDSLVMRADVEAAISARERAMRSGLPASGGADGVVDVPSGVGAVDVRVPISGMRKLIGERLSRSRATIPEATVWLDVDATELLATKERLQKSTGERFSLTSLIARFVVSGLKQYPALNASIDEGRQEIVQHGAINLGIAAQTPRGLMVPVVHDAHELTTRQLKNEISVLVAAAEKGEYPPAALTGGTFTLNNYGGFGVDGSSPIINFPEAAMLGIGRVIDRPWVVDGQLAVRKVVVLSFVFDHRVCDGDVASGFLTYVARCIEEPLLLLSNV